MFRCLECGCSRFDNEGVGCQLCGRAAGPRSEKCLITEDTKTKLLTHSEDLKDLGVTVAQSTPLEKDFGATVGVIALVIQVAEAWQPGSLRKVVLYLSENLSLRRDEILRLRLCEPEDIDKALNEKEPKN
jgi:hypothetical protein